MNLHTYTDVSPMKNVVATLTALAVLQFVLVSSTGQDTEQRLVEVLRSDASAAEKCEACNLLRLHGTPRCVAALAACLENPHISQAARHALEGIASPEAVEALRNALSRTSGSIKVGIIDSLGWLGDTESVPLLRSLLEDNDTTIAATAAAALGRIGGKNATEALISAWGKSSPSLATAIADALLQCADREYAKGNSDGAKEIYQKLLAQCDHDHVKVAANVGIIRVAGGHALEALTNSLLSTNHTAQMAALYLAAQLEHPLITETLANLLPRLPTTLQFAVLGALRQRGDRKAQIAVVAATEADNPSVRAAALAALGTIGDAEAVPVLLEGAKAADNVVQRASREALVALRYGDVATALVRQLSTPDLATQVEIVRALIARNERSAVPALIELAQTGSPSTRKAALQAVASLADQSHFAALVDLLVRAKDPDLRSEVLRAVESASERINSFGGVDVTPLVKALSESDLETRRALFTVAALFSDAAIREVFRTALTNTDSRIRNIAERALCSTRDSELLPDLLELIRKTADADLKSVAISGYIRAASDESSGLNPARRVELLVPLSTVALRPGDKRALLSALADLPDPRALQIAEHLTNDPDVRREAEITCVRLTRSLAQSHFEAVVRVLNRLSTGAVDFVVRTNAASLLKLVKSGWLCTGPYRIPGKQCQELFDVPFPPEQGEIAGVEWRRAPGSPDMSREGEVDLSSVVAGDHCVVYLRTRVYSPREQNVVFSIGSDDGIKLWVNNELVHSNNAVRGLVPAQDKAKGKLRTGWNELLAKITQHTAGCGMILKILGEDGGTLSGIVFDPEGDRGQ